MGADWRAVKDCCAARWLLSGLMSTTEDFLRRHPLCCFCGGSEPASTIDSQPAKIVFPDDLRPEEREFPACASCTKQTSADEALLALICRLIGSPQRDLAPEFDRLRETFTTVRQRFPGLLERMGQGQIFIQRRGRLVREGRINVNQREVHESMCRIAAKLALAIYYESKGTPAPTTCRIKTLWTHCQNAATFQQVTNTIRVNAGKWQGNKNFFLTFLLEGGMLASMSIFHEAVAFIALLQAAPSRLEGNEHWAFVMAPEAGSGIRIIRPRRGDPRTRTTVLR